MRIDQQKLAVARKEWADQLKSLSQKELEHYQEVMSESGIKDTLWQIKGVIETVRMQNKVSAFSQKKINTNTD